MNAKNNIELSKKYLNKINNSLNIFEKKINEYELEIEKYKRKIFILEKELSNKIIRFQIANSNEVLSQLKKINLKINVIAEEICYTENYVYRMICGLENCNEFLRNYLNEHDIIVKYYIK